ncbi:MAG: type II toxin-antitoxin system prevent-host-death family antitoxin [Candidatus Sumerlaeota bacterium]|nr:type II toxin-antitoxin system prevent-host-death family antitoxin [Candidatus Sumerlaeota bacterium]
MTRLTVAKARDHFAEAIDRVVQHGERIVLTSGGRTVACLVPVQDLPRLKKLEQQDSGNQPPKRRKPRSVWEEILEIADSIPDEDLQRVPADSSINLDHYLYGAAKRKS